MKSREEGEVAIVGLARSGIAVSELLLKNNRKVYASDAGIGEAISGAAARLTALGADVEVGGHDSSRISNAALVVVSPGVPPDAPPVRAARAAKRRIASEVEVALGYLASSRIIGVTGTNGKTTTTALIAHIFHGLGKRAVAAGNIGMPLSSIALLEHSPEWIAVELSSFQLHDTPSFNPVVGILTNLSADHLDRYASVEEYYADKRLFFRNATDRSIWVVNGDDERALAMTAKVKGSRRLFSVKSEADAYYDARALSLRVLGSDILRRSELPLIGTHNVANALAAALAVMLAESEFSNAAARARIAEALRSFAPLPHRLELVAEAGGIRWVNDSKATNIGSTLVAIEGMERPTILLLGGRHKGEPYTLLADAIRNKVKRVIAFGEAAPLIARDLSGIVRVDKLGSDFAKVVAAARSAAAPGETILLSPACASYDMFSSFEERGDRFRELVTTPDRRSGNDGDNEK